MGAIMTGHNYGYDRYHHTPSFRNVRSTYTESIIQTERELLAGIFLRWIPAFAGMTQGAGMTRALQE